MSEFRLEVRDAAGAWVPAVNGDATASTFETVTEATSVLDHDVLPRRPRAVRLLRSDGVVVFVSDYPAAGRAS